MKLRAQLLLFSIVLVIVTVVVADFLVRSAISRQLTEDLRDDIHARLAIIARAPDVAAAGAAAGMTVGAVDVAATDRAAVPTEIAAALASGRGSAVYGDKMNLALRVTRGGRDQLLVTQTSLARVQSSAAAARLVLAGASLLFLCAAAALVFVATSRISRVARQLTAAARRMAAGDLAARSRVSGSDELGSLGRSLDELASGMERTLGELSSERDRAADILATMQEGLLVLDGGGRIQVVNPALREMLLLGADVVGKKPLEIIRHAPLKELIERGGSGEIELSGVRPRRLLVRVARLGEAGSKLVVFFDVTDLRRLESLRRDFVANVSHELRTPVTAVRSAAETMRTVLPGDPATAQRFLDIIERNAERLQDLVEDVLDLSRIESRQYNLRLEPQALAPLFTHATAALRERAEKKGIKLRSEAAGDSVAARADRRALDQVLSNLIDNAIKYCGSGATVTVRAAARGADVEITVEDDGPGIEARHLPRIFERFYRVDAGRGRESGGTGLGLSIVKNLVEAMGGRVTVRSQVGEGSTFSVTMPAARAA